ncbi:DUF485 domain-containing protein [Streptomyces sp. NPDC052225]|uniref:DUF485 domain-containing protein n=1 Tax=Streptomyces sp. NPDC052225 TaxID=3154949 RepID=UPI00343EBCDA
MSEPYQPFAQQPPRTAHSHRLPRHPDRGPAQSGPAGELMLLRTAYRWQRRVSTLTAIGYFLTFLVLSAFAPSLMTRAVTGGLSLGLLIGLCQFPVTCFAVYVYEHTARRRVDPLAYRLRRQGGAR